MSQEIIWMLVNCASLEEAKRIGLAALHERLVSCYDVFKREEAAYFWPPKTGQVEHAQGALLILETLQHKAQALRERVAALHRDQLPFIGVVKIVDVSDVYVQWMEGEIRSE